jgi:hypothetical protein
VDDAFAQFERAKLQLEAYRQKNAKVITQYEALRADVKAAYEAVKTLYEQHKDAIGPTYNGFSVQQKRGIDAHLLVDLMPDAIALVKYTLAVGTFEKLVREGTIDEDIAEQVQFITENITGPGA